MIETLAKRFLPALTASIFLAAVVTSFLSVSGNMYPTPGNNYFNNLESAIKAKRAQLKLAGADLAQSQEELALLLWQNMQWNEASDSLHRLGTADIVAKTKPYNDVFVRRQLHLAGICLDEGAFDEARACYQTILDYDKKALPETDIRVGRDFNNLGLCLFLSGEAKAADDDRNLLFEQGLAACQSAEKILSNTQAGGADLVYSLQNQALLLDELGKNARAQTMDKQVEKTLDKWNASFGLFAG